MVNIFKMEMYKISREMCIKEKNNNSVKYLLQFNLFVHKNNNKIRIFAN